MNSTLAVLANLACSRRLLTEYFEFREVGVRVNIGTAQVRPEVIFPRMLCAQVVDEQSAVPLIEVSQQLGATLVALVHHVRAGLEDNGREQLRVRLAEVPDAVHAVVRAGAVGEHEGTRDDNAGVGHGRDVPRQPDLPEGRGSPTSALSS